MSTSEVSGGVQIIIETLADQISIPNLTGKVYVLHRQFINDIRDSGMLIVLFDNLSDFDCTAAPLNPIDLHAGDIVMQRGVDNRLAPLLFVDSEYVLTIWLKRIG